jgi:hypothetical protein
MNTTSKIQNKLNELKVAPLQACPFCGSKELGNIFHDSFPNIFRVYCVNCCTEGPVSDNEYDAKERWNTRKL